MAETPKFIDKLRLESQTRTISTHRHRPQSRDSQTRRINNHRLNRKNDNDIDKIKKTMTLMIDFDLTVAKFASKNDVV